MKQVERLPIQQNRAAKTTKPCIPPEIKETLSFDETGGEARLTRPILGIMIPPVPVHIHLCKIIKSPQEQKWQEKPDFQVGSTYIVISGQK
jgi:hypothetical protein